MPQAQFSFMVCVTLFMSLPRLDSSIRATRCKTLHPPPKGSSRTLEECLASSAFHPFAGAIAALPRIARPLRQRSRLVSSQNFPTSFHLHLTWTKTSAPWTSHVLPCNPAILPDADAPPQRFKKGVKICSRVPLVATFSSPPMCCRLPQLELDRILRNWPGDRWPGAGDSRGGISLSHLLPAHRAFTD
jgi:hypothetical protein